MIDLLISTITPFYFGLALVVVPIRVLFLVFRHPDVFIPSDLFRPLFAVFAFPGNFICSFGFKNEKRILAVLAAATNVVILLLSTGLFYSPFLMFHKNPVMTVLSAIAVASYIPACRGHDWYKRPSVLFLPKENYQLLSSSNSIWNEYYPDATLEFPSYDTVYYWIPFLGGGMYSTESERITAYGVDPKTVQHLLKVLLFAYDSSFDQKRLDRLILLIDRFMNSEDEQSKLIRLYGYILYIAKNSSDDEKITITIKVPN